MAPYSVAFGAVLLSTALWMQQGWGWSALKAGIAIAPGPFMVPVTSLLFSGRLIAWLGVAGTAAFGVVLFAAGIVWWAALCGLEPDMPMALARMVITGIGVGLTYPTILGAATAALPPSSFATGSGVLNMTRQTFLAIGVALFVAIVGAPQTPLARLAAYDRAWWIMAALALIALLPLVLLKRPKERDQRVSRTA
jgi:MFS family permease